MTSHLPLKDYLSSNSLQPDRSVAFGETWVFNENYDNQVNRFRKISLKNWWMGTLYHHPDPTETLILLFWINFFSLEMHRMTYATRSFTYLETIRMHGTTHFRELILEMILEQTLMHHVKKIKPPTENLQDAFINHLLGRYLIGPDYQQHISKEKLKNLKKLINQGNHIYDSFMVTPKKNKIPEEGLQRIHYRRQTPAVLAYIENLQDYLDRLFSATSVDQHITKKMLLWITNQEKGAPGEEKLIRNASQIFRENNYNMRSLTNYLMNDQHVSVELYPNKHIQNPASFLIDLLKQHPSPFRGNVLSIEEYPLYEWMRIQTELMGQDAADVPVSTGWPDYTLSPAQQCWLSEDMQARRAEVVRLILHSGTVARFPFSEKTYD